MMNISKETVDFLIYNELSYSSHGEFLRIQSSLKSLVMLGGSPEMLMFCLVDNINKSDDPKFSGSLIALYSLCQYTYRDNITNWITSLSEYDKPDKNRVTLERFNTKTLLNVTLTSNVFWLFKHNKDTLFFEKDSPVREGMSILDFLLVKREQIANESSDEKNQEMIKSVDALIDLFVEKGAKPTPKLLLHTLKQGKDCSVLEGQINKMKCA